MSKIICRIFFSCFAITACLPAFTQSLLPKDVLLRVVIIRHGEKPDSGDNLSCQGLNRALLLPAVLDTVTGHPDYTYVPMISTGGKKTSSVRMFQTVTPFAVQQNLPINSTFKEDSVVQAAADIKKKRGMVLMVWEHSNIPPLAKAFGVKGKLSWSGKDFGSIWIIDFSKTDKKGNLKDPVLTIEQENLNPPTTCPTQ